MDYVQLGASRAHHDLGPWAWHERGGDVVLGWVTWLVHGDEGWVGIGLLAEVFFPLVRVERLAGGFSRGEDMGLGRVTWNFFSYKMLLF